MNISVLGSPAGPQYPAPQNGIRQQAHDLNAIANALQVGDVAGARKAFDAFQQRSPQTPNPAPAQGGPAAPLQAKLQNLATALGDGDLRGSAQAYRALRDEIQTSRKSNQPQPQNDNQTGVSPDDSAADATAAPEPGPSPQVGSRLNVQA